MDANERQARFRTPRRHPVAFENLVFCSGASASTTVPLPAHCQSPLRAQLGPGGPIFIVERASEMKPIPFRSTRVAVGFPRAAAAAGLCYRPIAVANALDTTSRRRTHSFCEKVPATSGLVVCQTQPLLVSERVSSCLNVSPRVSSCLNRPSSSSSRRGYGCRAGGCAHSAPRSTSSAWGSRSPCRTRTHARSPSTSRRTRLGRN